MRRTLYYKQQKAFPLDLKEMKKAGELINELLGKNNNVMGKFLDYIYDKNYLDCHFFVDHFLNRLNVLYQDKKVELPADKEFLDNLKKC